MGKPRDRLRCPVPEVTDTSPLFCPRCATVITEFVWLFEGQYFCKPTCVGTVTKTYSAPRNSYGAIDWTAYYEGYYGRPAS